MLSAASPNGAMAGCVQRHECGGTALSSGQHEGDAASLGGGGRHARPFGRGNQDEAANGHLNGTQSARAPIAGRNGCVPLDAEHEGSLTLLAPESSRYVQRWAFTP